MLLAGCKVHRNNNNSRVKNAEDTKESEIDYTKPNSSSLLKASHPFKQFSVRMGDTHALNLWKKVSEEVSTYHPSKETCSKESIILFGLLIHECCF